MWAGAVASSLGLLQVDVVTIGTAILALTVVIYGFSVVKGMVDTAHGRVKPEDVGEWWEVGRVKPEDVGEWWEV